jgi:hypothetical protein
MHSCQLDAVVGHGSRQDRNAIGYFEGNVIKYVSRWRKKNGKAMVDMMVMGSI